MDELFPATRLVTIKNAGHWVHSEQPEIFTGDAPAVPRGGREKVIGLVEAA
jgi:pimeloyl-ACP methyl ester carboxylesterase